ncbi:MAG TPA: phosphotransferase [Dokdonella sp.]|uniref:aminoglycoside phosphotransferase family protein n=1 Tax=Dokdonella sp. TaxID=2291710 RepID=UPI002D7F10F3|nr:phosphotransferase [Dokdonella sp.]HET9033075.1 phosphotransferase [Dokdonella sp.]
MTATTDRQAARQKFVSNALSTEHFTLASASADASFRSYWRISLTATESMPARHLVVMDAPPDKEDLDSWLDVDARLRKAGLNAPEVFAVDRELGFVLMQDLGVRTYLPELNEHSVDELYADAFDALLRMQTTVDVAGLPEYDRQRLIAEMELLPEWFLKRHLGYAIACEEWDVIEAAFTFLVQAADEQPRAFVHRDFHSRNLMIVDHDGVAAESGRLINPAIIDFQDAVIGPLTYDLVSLLRDCYIEWDKERVEGWVEGYRIRLQAAHLLNSKISATQFARWFDLMGLQRHIKVLGIFCRLWYRDGKRQYLDDLDLCWRYAIDVSRRYPELHDFAALLERALGDRDIRSNRELSAS